MITADTRLIAVILCLVLIGIPLAHAVDCPEGCSCMLAAEAKVNGYDPCGGKLTQCGFSNYGSTAKYCYATTRAMPAATMSSSGQPAIPYGWYAYHTIARVPKDDNTQMTIDSTLRYDISSEMFNGKSATRVRMDMRTSSSSVGSMHVAVDMYSDPVSSAVLGGTATVTGGGKTQTVNLAEIANIAQSNSGVTYTPPEDLRSSAFEDTMRMIARETGGHFSTNTESVTVPAGTFPAATRYSVSIPDSGGTSRMNIWTSAGVPVVLKMQGTDPAGTEISRMELTGYGITGSTSSGGLFAGILSGSGGTTRSPSSGDTSSSGFSDDYNGLPPGLNEFLTALSEAFTFSDHEGTGGFAGIDWDGVPTAASGSMTPAAIGALGAFLGIALGAYTILPDGGFSWSGWPDGEDGEWPDGEIVDPTSDGTGRTALEVVEQGGNTDLEQAAMGAGQDGVDQLAAPPESGPGPETENTVSSPQSSGIPEMTSGEPSSYDDEVETLHKFNNLKANVDTIIRQRSAQGYYVMNPDVIHKIWNFTLGGAIHWVTAATDHVGITKNRTWTGGTCGNLSGWGQQWLTDDVKKIFGPDVNVNELVINPGSRWNHAANQIVLPNGDRFVIDMWEGMSKGSSRIYTEDEWLAKWKTVFGQDAPLLRSNHENDLEVYIQKMGVKDGIDEFLTRYKNSPLAQITVKSFRNNPWFKPNPLPEI